MDVQWLGHENRYYFFGGKDESSYTLIQGITLAGVLLDEAALMPQSFVDQAVARCSVTDSRLWFNCNPDGSEEHWFFRTGLAEKLHLGKIGCTCILPWRTIMHCPMLSGSDTSECIPVYSMSGIFWGFGEWQKV